MEAEEHARVSVVEQYRNYAPPPDAALRVRRLLRYVPDEYLAGLKAVVLTNSASSREMRRGRTWTRGHKVSLAECGGFYREQQVTLLIDNLWRRAPASGLLRSFCIEQALAEVLYHEIGHHIHYCGHPTHREREDVADEWGKRLLGRYLRRRFWYLRCLKPLARPIVAVLHAVARAKGVDPRTGRRTGQSRPPA
jgi:hypothetical protein